MNAASPATVSRVAVVYISGETISWQHILDSWLSGQDPAETQYLHPMFVKLVPGLLQIIRNQCKPAISVNDSARVQSMLSMLRALLNEARTAVGELSKAHVTRLFCYAALWGIGGCVGRTERVTVDRM